MRSYQFNIGSRFLEVANNNSDQNVLAYPDGKKVSYGELCQLALELAHSFKEQGSRRPVALVHDKSPEMFAVMIALLILGIPYACVDPENPVSRLESILTTLNSAYLIVPSDVSGEIGTELSGVKVSVLKVSELRAGTRLNPDESVSTQGDQVAYVMFTSGSTGTPKGVAISHDNLLNFSDWAASELEIESGTKMTNVNPMYFDNSVLDFYGCVLNGGTLLPITRELLADFRSLSQFISEERPDCWFSVPSTLIFLNTMKVLSQEFLSSFKTIVFGGEGYPKSELRKLRSKIRSDCRLVNVYGPTECTCICSSRNLSDEDIQGDGLPPLGSMVPNFSSKILRDDGSLCSEGETGELVLLGPNVGLGYYGDKERTEQSFGFISEEGIERRCYRTGDLVAVEGSSGDLYFKGRKDNQIKHLGYRIELEEIEYALNSIDGVEQAAVIYVRDSASAGHIYAFLSGSLGEEDESVVRERAKSILPTYMLPSRIAFLRHFETNANGKIDKKRLAQMV